MVNKTKTAFTLAEVLITLVIIGIVAALTIPTAINKYNEEVRKSQFKKLYSTLVQAIYTTEMKDYYGYARCNAGTNGQVPQTWADCNTFYEALAKNLQVQKVCRGNAKTEGCVPTYTHGLQRGGCEFLLPSAIETTSYVYVLNNGQLIIAGVYSGNGSLIPMFMVDINGPKGPNILGKDLFEFGLEKDKTSGLYIKRALCFAAPAPGGKSTEEMIRYAFAGKK